MYRSEEYRTMKLLVLGCSKKERTTFVKRLTKKTMKTSHGDMVFEMDEWVYSPSSNIPPVTFDVWNLSRNVCSKCNNQI